MTDIKQPVKPMLAVEANLENLNYPVLVSPKLDGIRALVVEDAVQSRSGKAIPNRHIQSLLALPVFDGLDGEIILGDPTAPDCFSKTTSAVMSIEGEPGFTYFAFDLWDCYMPFKERYKLLEHSIQGHSFIYPVPQLTARNLEDVKGYEQQFIDKGYEGIILRNPEGFYKHGRSTQNEQLLLKLKRFKDAEAVVTGVEELQHNDNEAIRNGLGHTERSSSSSGLRGGGVLGALHCRDTATNTDFSIGTGFTMAQRQLFWSIRSELVGRLVKYKYFEVGMKDAPRHPVFLGFRDTRDV